MLLINYYYGTEYLIYNYILSFILLINLILKKNHTNNKVKKSFKNKLKIINFNIWYKNKKIFKLRELILEEKADLIQLQEVSYKNYLKFKLFFKNYYKFNSGFNSKSKDFDNVIFSKYKLYNTTYPCKRIVRTHIVKNNKKILIFGVHLFPWDNNTNFKNSLNQIKYLNKISPIGQKEAILFGDLNLVTCSNRFQEFIKKQKLFTKYYFIQNSSWPSFIPKFLGIKIDHVLHSKFFNISKEKVVGNLGSDHRLLISEIIF